MRPGMRRSHHPLLHALWRRGASAPRLNTHLNLVVRWVFSPTRLMVQILMADTVLSTQVSGAVLAGTLDGSVQGLALLLHDALGHAMGPLMTKLAIGLLPDGFKVLIHGPAFMLQIMMERFMFALAMIIAVALTVTPIPWLSYVDVPTWRRRGWRRRVAFVAATEVTVTIVDADSKRNTGVRGDARSN